jgi:hypothetical protein
MRFSAHFLVTASMVSMYMEDVLFQGYSSNSLHSVAPKCLSKDVSTACIINQSLVHMHYCCSSLKLYRTCPDVHGMFVFSFVSVPLYLLGVRFWIHASVCNS